MKSGDTKKSSVIGSKKNAMEMCTPASKVAKAVNAIDKKNADVKRDDRVDPGVDLSGMAGKKIYYYRE